MAGVLGLGGAQRSLTAIIPFWQSILLFNQLAEAQFSFWLGHLDGDPLAASDKPVGAFIFGGVNDSLYTGEIEFQPSAGVASHFWTLSLSGRFQNLRQHCADLL